MVTVAGPARPDLFESGLDVAPAGELPGEQVLRGLGVGHDGLPAGEAARRLARYGPNAVTSHRARLLPVLWHQLRSPLLGLLLVAAVASYFVGERSDAMIIGAIVALSVSLGLVNEYRAEKAAEALHSRIHHRALALRGGHSVAVDVTALVPGDVVDLQLGDIVPADIRLLQTSGLECDESVLTGESLPVDKDPSPVAAGTPLAELSGCALMGTVVHGGSGRGVVTATGARTRFGRIAAGLGGHPVETQFQVGLRRFSMLLVYVAAGLTVSIFVSNVVLHRPILDALLFSLAIAVGITPQLLPAVVSMSLAAGSRQMARRKVLVKRLVCIEDLGDIDTLFTDKTGTLTEGRISFMRAVGTDPAAPDAPLRWGLTCTGATVEDGHAVGGNPLDTALWDSPAALGHRAVLASDTRLATLPFDHERRLVSVLVRDGHGARTMVTKGAPEAVLDRCTDVPAATIRVLTAEFAAGNRVVAVATRPGHGRLLPRPRRSRQTAVLRRHPRTDRAAGTPHRTPPPTPPRRLLQHEPPERPTTAHQTRLTAPFASVEPGQRAAPRNPGPDPGQARDAPAAEDIAVPGGGDAW
jgi:Mg2+-importing ATPase